MGEGGESKGRASAPPAALNESALAPATRGQGSEFAFHALAASPPGGHLPPPRSPEGALKNVNLMASNSFPEETPLGKFLSLREGRLNTWVSDPQSELRLTAAGRALLLLSPFAGRRVALLLPPRPRSLFAGTPGPAWVGTGKVSARAGVGPRQRGRGPARGEERCLRREQ